MKNTYLFLLFLFCGLAAKIDAFAPTPSSAKIIASSTFGDVTKQSASFSFNTVVGQQAASSSSSSSSSTVLFGKKAARAAGNDRKGRKERVKKQKDDVIEVEAVVLESLPNAMFRCAIEGAPDTQEPVLATISGRIRKNYVKILVGDKVQIELSPYDLTRGRITFRFR